MSNMMPNIDVLDRFRRLMKVNRLAHAYLFIGALETGRTEAAAAIAQLVNCEGELTKPCGECPPCVKISNGNHPDIHLVGNNDETSIKIDEIRQILGRVGLLAFEAKTKVFIIIEAQRMTNEAANALLKTLEEPAPNTLIILTTAAVENCLDTIKSRCHMVKFFSLDDTLSEDRDKILDSFLSNVNNDEYLKSLSADKEKTAEAMKVLLSFVRDAYLYKSGVASTQLVYRNRLGAITQMSQKSRDDLNALSAQIVRVKSLVDDNLNVRMALSLVKERLWHN